MSLLLAATAANPRYVVTASVSTPSLNVEDATVNENGTATFTVTLTGSPAPAPRRGRVAGSRQPASAFPVVIEVRGRVPAVEILIPFGSAARQAGDCGWLLVVERLVGG